MGVPGLRELEISAPEPITPAGLAAAQYIAALRQMAHGTRDVLCSDSLCALTLQHAAARSPRSRRRAKARAEVLLRAAEAQECDDLDLRHYGRRRAATHLEEKQYYGASSGQANLLVLADVLSDEASAQRMAVVVAEAVKISAWVIVADQGPRASPVRKTFLDLLEGARVRRLRLPL